MATKININRDIKFYKVIHRLHYMDMYKRNKGRLKKRRIDNIKIDCEEMGLILNEAKSRTKDRGYGAWELVCGKAAVADGCIANAISKSSNTMHGYSMQRLRNGGPPPPVL